MGHTLDAPRNLINKTKHNRHRLKQIALQLLTNSKLSLINRCQFISRSASRLLRERENKRAHKQLLRKPGSVSEELLLFYIISVQNNSERSWYWWPEHSCSDFFLHNCTSSSSVVVANVFFTRGRCLCPTRAGTQASAAHCNCLSSAVDPMALSSRVLRNAVDAAKKSHWMLFVFFKKFNFFFTLPERQRQTHECVLPSDLISSCL